jgi:hypothetical protein
VCLADAGVLHVAGAFKHRLLDKHADADVLRRMVQQLPIQATGGGAIPSTHRRVTKLAIDHQSLSKQNTEYFNDLS